MSLASLESMTKTVILATALATIFVVSMLIAPAWSAGHVVLDKSEVKVKNGATLDVKIKVTAKIPKDENSAFGYAVQTDGGNKVLVLVTHVPAFDDSAFDDKKGGFHTHVLDLKAAAGGPCPAAAQFEVDFTVAPTDPGYKNSVGSKEVKIKNVPIADLGDAGVETIAAFLASIVGPVGAPTNVCVQVISTIP